MGDDKNLVNPLLAGIKNVPGLSVLLPTKALLYNHGEVSEPSKNSGEVHVHPMSAKDELIMKSPDLLMNGEAIRRVIKRCVPDINDPLEIFQPDLDTILIALRLVTYGEFLPIRVDNPFYNPRKKGSQEELDFQVNLKELIQKGKFLSKAEDCIVVLEETGQKVTCQPIQFKMALGIANEDLIVMPDDPEERKIVYQKRMKVFEALILNMVAEVDGISDKKLIQEWYEHIPAGIFSELSDKVEELSGLGPKITTTLKDPISNKTWECTIPINPADFFASGPSKKTGIK